MLNGALYSSERIWQIEKPPNSSPRLTSSITLPLAESINPLEDTPPQVILFCPTNLFKNNIKASIKLE